jgi:hypothetical protein
MTFSRILFPFALAVVLSAQGPATGPAPTPVAPAPAQVTSADKGPLCNGDTAPALAPDKFRVHGLIYPPHSEPLGASTLWLVNRDTGDRATAPEPKTCQENGRNRAVYTIDAPPGRYDLTIESENAVMGNEGVSGSAGQAARLDIHLRALTPRGKADSIILMLAGLTFLFSIWLIRWNNLAVPNRRALLARVSDLGFRVAESGLKGEAGYTDELKTIAGVLRGFNVLEWLFWSRGLETSGWKLVHRIEVNLLEVAAPEDIDARLISTEQRLLASDSSAAKDLASRIKDQASLTPPPSLLARRYLLKEALAYVYETGDVEFDSMTSWQNKAFWLTVTATILIAALTLSIGHPDLFLAGAAGGFLSRLMRQLKRADVPSDYGASWSTLFLSPVSGALAGWFGVALIMLLSDPQVGVLAGPLKVINWDASVIAPTLAIAFALGFSERLFDGIMDQIEETVEKKQDDKQKATTTTAPLRPAVSQPAPLMAHPGAMLTVPVNPSLLTGATGVILRAPDPVGDVSASDMKTGPLSVTFTIPETVQPGSYSIVMAAGTALTPTQKNVTVIAA